MADRHLLKSADVGVAGRLWSVPRSAAGDPQCPPNEDVLLVVPDRLRLKVTATGKSVDLSGVPLLFMQTTTPCRWFLGADVGLPNNFRVRSDISLIDDIASPPHWQCQIVVEDMDVGGGGLAFCLYRTPSYSYQFGVPTTEKMWEVKAINADDYTELNQGRIAVHNLGMQPFPIQPLYTLVSLDEDGPPPQAPCCCGVATVACCFPDETCEDLSCEECQSQGGECQPEGTNCDDVDCELPEACCDCNGECTFQKPADCVASGGFPAGQGTDCGPPAPCITQPCCYNDGSCDEFLWRPGGTSCCEDTGGQDFGNPGQTCDDITCPAPIGPCCLPNCSVVQLTEEECLDAGGSWGDDSDPCCQCNDCGPDTCDFTEPPGCLYQIQLPRLQGDGPFPSSLSCSVCDNCYVPACTAVSESDACCFGIQFDLSNCPVENNCPPDPPPPPCNDNRESRWISVNIVCNTVTNIWFMSAIMTISNCSSTSQILFFKAGGSCPEGAYAPCPYDSPDPCQGTFCDTGTCCNPNNCVITPDGPAIVTRLS